MLANGDMETEINTIIALASNTFNRLINIWKAKSISIKTKLKLYNACILPVLTYGRESWKSTSQIEKRLDSFENKCLRKIATSNG